MIRVLLVLFAGLVGVPGLAPSAPEAFVVGAGSRFWIDGTSTMSHFTCEAGQAAGFATVETETAQAAVEAVVAVPVRAFDCGVRQMNRDLYDALRGAEHPAIRFALSGAETLGPPNDDGWVSLGAWGTLTLAGAQRPLTLTARGRRHVDGHVQIQGVHALRMTDFGIDPPTGFLGLVRAHDQIIVRFDLVATAK